MEQWLFSIFSICSGMIGLGYGAYAPNTWGEALVWVFAMLVSQTYTTALLSHCAYHAGQSSP